MLQYIMLEAKVGELFKASEIYVDMDGVLADFFMAGKNNEGRLLSQN